MCDAQAAGPPNFSGQWSLAHSQGDLGGFSAPSVLEKTIVFQDPKLRVHNSQTTDGKTTVQDMYYFTNGFETKNFLNGLNAYSEAHWAGATLVIHTNLQDKAGGALVLEERWTLGDDQGTLTTTTKIVTARGSTTTKLVWKKQA